MADPNSIPGKGPVNRRQFMRDSARVAAMTGLGGLLGMLATHTTAKNLVWQIDPQKCVRCGNCATSCVLEQSAVKCVHAYAMCGYCELCTGYFEPEPNDLNTGAENCLCPTWPSDARMSKTLTSKCTIDETLHRLREMRGRLLALWQWFTLSTGAA
jgi:electron transport complex protein RnfB